MTRGKCVSTFLAPKRVISVSRPGSLCGFKTCTSCCKCSSVTLVPIFTAIGFAMPRKYSMCAPFKSAVRMPIHG